MKRYYFDYAASTPVDKEVERAMKPYWSNIFGNPGSLHSFGQDASAAVFGAREKIAELINCHYKEIVFTGSATEANNLVLQGIVKRALRKGIKNPKIITLAIEHESILDTCEDLKKDGIKIIYLPILKSGIVDLKKLKESLDKQTILVSVMYANNQIGSIQPIKEISKIIKDFRKTNNYPLFHTDAAQALNYLDCRVNECRTKSAKGGSPEHFVSQNVLGVDLMTLSSQKIYGPKGIGMLYIRQNQESRIRNQENKKPVIHNSSFIIPIITGGGQERGMRAGTENVPGIVGFAKAMKLVSNSRELENKRLRKLQKYFLKQIKKKIPRVELNGDIKNRLPNNINIYIPSADKNLLIKLDLLGFSLSGGAACSARVYKPSHVLKALGFSDEKAKNSLRITFGRSTTKKDIDKLLNMLYNLVSKK